MAESTDRPNLRVVRPDEKIRPEEEVAASPVPAAVPLDPPSAAATAFSKGVDVVDATVPLNAAYLVCAGCFAADTVLDMYHQAVAHAPPGTFRRDVPPGLKSAQATRAWLGTHLQAIKKKATETDAATADYARAADLKQAVALVAAEADRAVSAAKVAGLKLDDRRDNLLKDVTGSLVPPDRTPAEKIEPHVAPEAEIKFVDAEDDLYVFGACVLGCSTPIRLTTNK